MKPDNTDETGHDEFPEGASEWAADEVSRRKFLGVMGASIALATGAGCNIRPAPQRKILPYTTQPDELTPGLPNFYATAAVLGGYAEGLLVRSHEGRPVKVEGNPDHPSSLGGTSVFAQASVLDLYDPDRSREVTERGLSTTYDRAILAVRNQLFNANGTKKPVRLRILTETVTSFTLADQIAKLLAEFPDARWVQHDAICPKNLREGVQKAFGKPATVVYDFKKADVVLALDSDFTCTGPGSTRYSHDFATRRRVRSAEFFKHAHGADLKGNYVTTANMSRLYAVESMPTNTGATADHRLALNTSQIESFARALAARLKELGASFPGTLPAAGPLPPAAAEWIKPLADDLWKNKGKSIVVAGLPASAALHTLVLAINSALDNIGKDKPVQVTAPVEARVEGKVDNLTKLTADMAAKQVDALLILGGCNPVYSAPADVPFGEAMANVPFTFHLGLHQDETAVLALWHVNEAHPLEVWGDSRGHDGTAAVQQPLIAPLYQGKSALEFLADVMSQPARDGLEIVRRFWRARYKPAKPGDEFDVDWDIWTQAGVIPNTTAAVDEKAALAGNWAEGAPAISEPAKYELNFRADPTLYDGRFANNGWLQELPKPLTKITWDNAAFMSPATAKELACHTDFAWTGGEHGRAIVNVVELTLGDRKVLAPVWVLPGHADGCVTVHLGYGRTRAGRVATTPDEPNADGKPVRGFNAYTLRGKDQPWSTGGLKVTKTDKTYFLACTQGHWSMIEKDPFSGKELNRKPVRRGTVELYNRVPAFAKIPPMAAGETDLINENVPAPKPHTHNGSDDKHDNHEAHGHDPRLTPLTMYYPENTLAPNLPKEQFRRWGMAIDLSACTGCSACVVACQSENNIPVVGKEQVTKGRAMHWINIDRYYGGTQRDPDPVETSLQPRMCVQCENAPCEVVCPVGATVHSTDGLNDMAYNRCVGTRYCSNNCPYKVRRFNFLTFADWNTASYKLGRNPDVSVRSRGVMEKCTFCVQRIRGAEVVAEREYARGIRKADGPLIRDGEILTACQSACPSGAIVFGDLNDDEAMVSRWKNEPANYGLLAELNTRPRLTHLAAIRNPNPAMPKGA